MSGPTLFDGEAGQNIQLSTNRQEARWSPTQSGGWVYCACAIKPGDSVLVNLDGSGHCDVGFIGESPCIRGKKKEIAMAKLNGVRIHKRACTITMTMKDNGKEVYSIFEGSRTRKKTDKTGQVWVAVYVKFGNVTVQTFANGSSDERLPFSDNHGANIQLDEDTRKASTVSVNPAAICLLKMRVGQTVKLKCNPIPDGSRDPSRYHLRIQAADSSPAELRRDFPHMFDPQAKLGRVAPLTTLELLEKDECKGNVEIRLCGSNIIEYTTASSKRNTQTLQFVTSYGVWLVLELFRVSVIIDKTTTAFNAPSTTGTGCVESRGRLDNTSKPTSGTNVPDSRRREPKNEYAENSFATYTCHPSPPQPLHATALGYVSVTKVKEVTDSNNNNNYSNNNNSNTKPKWCCSEAADANIIRRLDRLEERLTQASEELLRTMQTSSSGCPKCGTSQSSFDSQAVTATGGELDSQSLQRHWVELVDTMRVERLCDHLFEKKVISEHDMHELLELTKQNARAANRKLLQLLTLRRIRKSLVWQVLTKAEETHLMPLMFPEE